MIKATTLFFEKTWLGAITGVCSGLYLHLQGIYDVLTNEKLLKLAGAAGIYAGTTLAVINLTVKLSAWTVRTIKRLRKKQNNSTPEIQ